MNSKNRTPEPSSHTPARPGIGARILKHVSICALTVAGCSLLVLFSIKITPAVRAQGTPTPTPTCTVTPTISPTATPTSTICIDCLPHAIPSETPTPTAIPNDYQPHGHDGTNTVLEWRPFAPPTGSGPWPGILVLHTGGFKTGGVSGGEIEGVARDLAAAGYYAVIATYRLAPCGLIKGQTCHNSTDDPNGLSGRPPQQISDVKSLVRALRNDSHCTGKKIGVVGGSAGGTHAVWTAIDQTTSTVWPVWGAAERPDAVVALSGAYDFADRFVPSYEPLDQFTSDITNYTNLAGPDAQKVWGPAYLLGLSGTPSDVKPVFLLNSNEDPMPYHQIIDMLCALQNKGVSTSLYKVMTVPSDDAHAWDYWRDWDGIPPVGSEPSHPVSFDVISFLDSHLK